MVPRIVKFIETDSRIVIAGGLGMWGMKGYLFNRYRVVVLQDDKSPVGIYGGDVAQHCECI